MISPTAFRFSPRANRAHLVHWRAWGDAAFEEAARSRKLIALFITAFWCGVCQRLDETALSSDEVQLLLNAYFVPIRVEESRRPDVDLRYTQDGWPTIVFLTDAEPMLTVNGMEPEPLIRLLVQLVDLHERAEEEAARELDAAPGAYAPKGGGSRVIEGHDTPAADGPDVARPDVTRLSRATVGEIVELLVGLEDRAHGGFGGRQSISMPTRCCGTCNWRMRGFRGTCD